MKIDLKCRYHKITANEDVLNKINTFLSNPASNNKTEDLDEHQFYILDDFEIQKDFTCFTLAKVDTTDKLKLDDIITQQRRPVDKNDNEGLATDAQFLYRSDINVLIQKTGRSIATIGNLHEFIAQKIDIPTNEIEFDLIIERDLMQKFSEIDIFEKLIFKIAKPEQRSIFYDPNNSIHANVKLTEELDADNLKIEITGKKLKKSKAKEIIGLLKKGHTDADIELKSLSLYGGRDVLDFIKGKLEYSDTIETQETEVSNLEIYQFLKEGYTHNESYLKAYANG